MSICFHLPFRSSENSYITIQLVDWLNGKNIAANILSLGEKYTTIRPIKTDYQVPLKQFIAMNHCSHVVWFGDVSEFDIQDAKSMKVKTMLIASWDDRKNYQSFYKKVDKVICLSPSLTQKLKHELNLKNLVYAPLDLPLIQPRTSLLLRPDKPKLLLNLRGPKSSQFGSLLLPTLVKWFHQITAEWTIWISKNLNHKRAWINKAFLSPNEDSSFKFVTDNDWDTQRLLYGNSDFTIWPVIKGGHALTPILSLLMGSPVVTFDVPPANEYLSDLNGVLVSCTAQYTKQGLATLMPDLVKLELQVTKLLKHPLALSQMKNHTSDWTIERRKLFETNWLEIFGE